MVCDALADGVDWLGRLADGWDAIVAEEADSRGRALFGAIAALCGRVLDEGQMRAADAWGLADLAWLTGEPGFLNAAREREGGLNAALFRKPLTSLGVMTALARHNVTRGFDAAWAPGSPKRITRALQFAILRR